MSNRKGRVKKF